MTSISKYVYFYNLNDIVDKCNNTHHRTIKTKPVDVKPSIYIDLNKENNKESPKFKIGDNVRISKYKNIFAKLVKLCYKLVRGLILLVILTKKNLLERLTKKNCKNKPKRV